MNFKHIFLVFIIMFSAFAFCCKPKEQTKTKEPTPIESGETKEPTVSEPTEPVATPTPAEPISFTCEDVNVKVGEEIVFNIEASNLGEMTIDEFKSLLEFNFSNEDLIEVVDSEIFAKQAGACKVVITYKNDESISYEAKVIIEQNAMIEYTSVSGYEDEINLGSEFDLTVNYECIGDVTVTFGSSNSDVISIDQNGHVVALAEGISTITVTFTSKDDMSQVDIDIIVVLNESYISYHLNGGTVNNRPTKYVEGEELVLPTPVKSGYDFLGWTLEANSTEYITKIDATMTGDIHIYAHWAEITSIGPFTINYVYQDGHLPTHTATSLSEFADYFWNEFYKWANATNGVESFKQEQLNAWKSGSQKAKLFSEGQKTVVDDGYFCNAKGNDIWREWFNVVDALTNEINSNQTAWGSAYVAYIRLYAFFNESSSYVTASRLQKFYSVVPVPTPLVEEYTVGETQNLVELAIDDGRTFLGWYNENDTKVTDTSNLRGNVTLNAKWSASTPVEAFTVTNQITSIKKFTSHQLQWTFAPANCTNKSVKFVSSDPTILAVNADGLLEALRTGNVTLQIICLDNDAFNITLQIEVYIDPFIDLYFNTTSYVYVDNTIKLEPEVYGINNAKVLYSVSDNTIASIDENGILTGLQDGQVTVTMKVEGHEDTKLEVIIPVLSHNDDAFVKIIAEAHNNDIHVYRDLPVAGNAYKTDVYNSVSDLLYNFTYSINRSYEAKQASVDSNHGGARTSTEFICVHYTAGASAGSTAAANASYFANGGSQSSIHYTTGNDGIYHILDDSLVGWHAGDGTGVKFQWLNTGVKATANVKPVWGVVKNNASSSGYYFTLNGQATTIVVPTTGTTSGGSTKTMTDPSKCFTYFGPAWKVVEGVYYMGTTWACFTQTLAGAISSRGGNLNSVGIETACNKGSDLWLTYQYTAQLIARLLDTYNLETYRVVGHNAFSGKNCPQTLLENDAELWPFFMECVEAEYALYENMTKDNKYTISCKVSDNTYVQNNGRVSSIPNDTTPINYTVTIKDNSTQTTKTYTFTTIIHGRYTE